MLNNTISQVEINGTTYDLLDMNTLSAASAIERRVTTLENSVATTSTLGRVMVDGTSITVDSNGVISSTGSLSTLTFYEPTGRYINESISEWLKTMANGLTYGVSIPKSSATGCTKTGANAAMADPVPGVIGTPAVDPYVGVGPFIFFEANGGVDEDGSPYVTSIKGIDDRFRRDGSNGDVVILTPVLKWSYDETDSESCLLEISDTKYDSNEYQPFAYLPDGRLRPYMLYAKYAGGMYENRFASVSGVKPRREITHDALITICKNSSTGYSGRGVVDDWYVKVMYLLKYATKDSQSVMAGCVEYDHAYRPAVAESNVKRVILSNANADTLLVGSSMALGTSSDRASSNFYSKFDSLRISSIEEYDENRKAVYFDTETTFSTATSNYLNTMPWYSGACDSVEGDGSPYNNSSSDEPFVIQGIECMVGLWEIFGDIIVTSNGSSGWFPKINFDSRKESTSATSNYVSTNKSLPVDSSESGKYPLYLSNGLGLLFGTTTGGSTTTGLCDGSFVPKKSESGSRAWSTFGRHGTGAGGGLFSVGCNDLLNYPYWSYGSRLSYCGRSRN